MHYAAKDRGFGDFSYHASSMSKGHWRMILGTVCSLRWGPPRPQGRLSQSPPRGDKQPLFQDRPRSWPPEGGLGAGTDPWWEERVGGGLQKSEEVILSPGVQMAFRGHEWGTTLSSASERRHRSYWVLPSGDLGVAGEKENKIVLWFSAVTNLGQCKESCVLDATRKPKPGLDVRTPESSTEMYTPCYVSKGTLHKNLCRGFVITALLTSPIKCWAIHGWNKLNYSCAVPSQHIC